MKIRAFLIGVAVFLAATFTSSLRAEIVGVEQFDYSDGAIDGQNGGTFWDWQNRLTPAPGPRHTGTPSNWNGTPSVASGRLITNNSSARREYDGPGEGPGGNIETDEGFGAINNFSGNGISFQQHAVYYRVTFSTGATLPSFVSINSSDFGTDRVGFGASLDVANDNKFSIKEFSTNSITNSGTLLAANTTYTLVAKLDFVSGMATLFLNPNLNAAENLQTILRGPFPFNTANWSTSVRLASGTGGSVTWDDLVVATTWDELGTVVTTPADEDDGPTSLSTPTDISLREAVKYSPSGTLITFDPVLNGKTITLTHADGHIRVDKTLSIDASALPMGITIDGNHTSRHFFVTGASTAFALHALTLCNGTDLRDPAVFGGGFGGSVLLRDGKIAFRRCTFVGNTSINAGAIWLEGAGSSILENCTFTGNRGTDTIASGGVVVASGNLRLIHCTLSENVGAVYGALTFAEPATVNLQACIIARNRSVLGDFRDVSIFGDFSNSTAESNLIGSNLGVQGFFPSGPLVGTDAAPLDPKLSPLGTFGGPTMTMHPLIGSAAIDAGGTTDPGGTDQRGFPRFVDGDAASSGAQLDIGAVEAGPLRTVFTKSDTGSGQALRSILAGATSPGTRISFSSIIFPADTIMLNGTELGVSVGASLFIDASNLSGPVTISGNNASRVFNIPTGATVAMHSLVITEGRSFNGGGQASSGQDGGGILNDGSLSLFSCTITNNRSGNGSDGFSVFPGNGGNGGFGGGIDSRGRLSLTACNVSGNATGDGGDNGSGGPGGGISSTGPLSLTACTLANNVTGKGGNAASGSGGSGGAIFCSDSYRLTACTIAVNFTGNGGTDGSSNGAAGSGAGIFGGNAILQHCLIANNGTLSGSSDDVNVSSVTFLNANLLGIAANGSATGPAPIIAADAGLEPLANNGGPTQTMALRVGSPAIDAATGSTATSDQRGFPIVGVADIGAFEFQPTPTPTPTPSPTPTPTPTPAPVTFLIKAKANVSTRGTVSGGKKYVVNTFATVKAKSKSGFKFTKWTEGKKTVSTKASYRFKVTKNRTLVANFVKR